MHIRRGQVLPIQRCLESAPPQKAITSFYLRLPQKRIVKPFHFSNMPINDLNLDLEFLNIETYVLKVHLNCQGCRNRVKKLLRKIKGVYEVKIDAEGERVMVSGTVDVDTLINKLLRSGKHAELIWSPTSINNSNIQEQALPLMPIKDYTNNINLNRNQFLQQYLMNPQDCPNNHFNNGSLNHSPSLPFGSEGEIDQNLMMPFPFPLPMGGDGYDYGNGGFSDYTSLYGYGYDIHDHQSPMPMTMSNRYFNSPVLQSPLNMYGGDVHMMHHPYGAATDYRSSLVSPYSHHSFTIPPAPYTYY